MQKIFLVILIILIGFSCAKDKIIPEKLVTNSSNDVSVQKVKENMQDIIPDLPQSNKENISPYI